MDDENPVDDEIGKRVKRLRIARGWTQNGLAAAVGVSRSAVAQWETGRSVGSATNRARIAQALGVAPAELVPKGEPIVSGDKMPVIRLYRQCSPEDQQMLLYMARRLAKGIRRATHLDAT